MLYNYTWCDLSSHAVHFVTGRRWGLAIPRKELLQPLLNNQNTKSKGGHLL
jgi:hypothetical protein